MSHGILKPTQLLSLALISVSYMILVSSTIASAAASDAATHYCLHKVPQAACQQGYDAQKNGKSVQDACDSYADDNTKNTCQSAWGKAAGEDPAVYCNASNCDFVAKYVNPAINLLSASFGLIAVISLILGGIQYSSSEGDPQKSASAKSRISNTIIAIFAYLFFYAFVQFLIPGGAFH